MAECSAFLRSRGFYRTQCRRAAKVTREGQPYCGTHDPVAVKARDDARQKVRDERWELKQKRWAAEAALQKRERAIIALAPRLAEALASRQVPGLDNLAHLLKRARRLGLLKGQP